MKILFLIRSLDQGGAERQLVNLANSLRKRGHKIEIAVYYSGGVFETDLEEVPIHYLNKKGRWENLSFYFRLLCLVKKTSPDVLHSYMGSSNILAVLLKPFVTSSIAWGIRASKMNLAAYGKLQILLYWLESKLSRFADLIIVNSHQGKKDAILSGFSTKKLHVIPNGIDCEKFHPKPAENKALREHWAVDLTAPFIGLVGRLDVMKDHENFIESASILAHKNQHIKFVCIGGGTPDRLSSLKKFAEKFPILSGKILWTGAIQDLVPWYNALDLCVSSSAFGEGFSNTLAEAMACGTPCVATNVGDAQYILGKEGLTVPPKRPLELATACDLTLARTKATPSIKSILRERIIQYFSIDKLAQDTELLILNLIGKNK